MQDLHILTPPSLPPFPFYSLQAHNKIERQQQQQQQQPQQRKRKRTSPSLPPPSSSPSPLPVLPSRRKTEEGGREGGREGGKEVALDLYALLREGRRGLVSAAWPSPSGREEGGREGGREGGGGGDALPSLSLLFCVLPHAHLTLPSLHLSSLSVPSSSPDRSSREDFLPSFPSSGGEREEEEGGEGRAGRRKGAWMMRADRLAFFLGHIDKGSPE